MTAILSECGRYRYRLEREVGPFGPVAAVVMVNPSTADAHMDDPTIRRLLGFAKRFGWSRVIVGNVFAYRAADIRTLVGLADPVGPDNATQLRAILEDAEIAIVAWGTLAKLPAPLRDQWRQICTVADELGIELHHLGLARDGHPRHPLMLSYKAQLSVWEKP